MSAGHTSITVRRSEPETFDRAAVVAVQDDGAIAGRAALSRLYGARGAIDLELAEDTHVALALIEALEGVARERDLLRLEIDAGDIPSRLVVELRRSRHLTRVRRAETVHLIWPTTPTLVTE